MVKKGGLKKRSKAEPQDIVEDLDLDVGEYDVDTYADEDVVHNRRTRKAAREDEDDAFAGVVLPSDAHRLDGYGDDEHGNYLEEEELAAAAERGLRRDAQEDDFDIAGVSLGEVKAAKQKKSALKDALEASPVVEAVERDFAALSSNERLEILKKESPELLAMLDDLKKYLAEVKKLATPLHELLHERKVSEVDQNLVSFLETKVQLMLSYCMHVTFYLLLKTEGKKVAGHPVVDNLVEIRVYLEKMWPLEEKLQYSLNRLLSGKSTTAANVSNLRPVQGNESGAYTATRSVQNTEAKARRKALRERQEAEELEREEQAAMTRMRSKKATALNAHDFNTDVAPLSYQEDEDQYFSRITRDRANDGAEEEEGLSLMETLRRRQKMAESTRTQKESDGKRKSSAVDDVDDTEGDDAYDDDEVDDAFDEEQMDMISIDDGEDGGDADYDALVAEERSRDEEAKRLRTTPREKLVEPEVSRRQAGKKIESHRGLTKARPKDRKTPRVAQRRKYERGMRVHKAQTRPYQPEPEGGFVGVRSLKPGVTRGLKLQ